MLELITAYSLSNVPYIDDSALEDYAEELVKDFSPEILLSPQPFDAERFIEYYLRLHVEYKRLVYGQRILGMTAFNDGYIEVLNDETGLKEAIDVNAGTVIIDPLLALKRNRPRMRFTITHEGCHWIMHRKAFELANPLSAVRIYDDQPLAAKTGRGDYSRSRRLKTDIDRIERQADFLASAIVMPKDPLRMAYCSFFRSRGEKPWKNIVRGRSETDDQYAKALPLYVAKLFGVSKKAATIRLEKLTAILDKQNIGFHTQLTITQNK